MAFYFLQADSVRFFRGFLFFLLVLEYTLRVAMPYALNISLALQHHRGLVIRRVQYRPPLRPLYTWYILIPGAMDRSCFTFLRSVLGVDSLHEVSRKFVAFHPPCF